MTHQQQVQSIAAAGWSSVDFAVKFVWNNQFDMLLSGSRSNRSKIAGLVSDRASIHNRPVFRINDVVGSHSLQ